MRSAGIHRAAKIVITILIFAALTAVFLWRFHVVNAECPTPLRETYQLNEPVLHNGVEYTLSNYKVLDEDTFCEQYDIDPIHVKESGLNSKIIVVTMYAENVSDHNVNVDFTGLMLLQLGNYQCTYMYYVPLFPLLNPDKPTAGVMLPGHSIKLVIPYQVNEYEWNKAEYENLENETTQMVFSIYPVKKTVLLHASEEDT